MLRRKKYNILVFLIIATLILTGCGTNNENRDNEQAKPEYELVAEASKSDSEIDSNGSETDGDEGNTTAQDTGRSMQVEDEEKTAVNVSANDNTAGISDDTAAPEKEVYEYNVYFDLFYDEGVVMAQYDIDIYLGTEKIGTVSKGHSFSLQTTVKSDVTDIYFYNAADNSIFTTKKILLKGDTTFKFSLKSRPDGIEVNDFAQLSGIIGASVPMPNAVDAMLPDAIALLKDAGFENASYRSDISETIVDVDKWIVTGQNVQAGSTADRNTEIILTADRVADYAANLFIGLSVNSAGEKAEQTGFSLTYYDAATGEEVLPRNLSGYEILLMKVTSVISASENEKKAKLAVEYTAELVVPDVTEMLLQDALSLLSEMRFSNVVVNSVAGTNISDDKLWKVVSQSSAGGQRITANHELVLYVTEYIPPVTPTPIPKWGERTDGESLGITDPYALSMMIGETRDVVLTFSYSNVKAKDVTASFSDDSVASVETGKITENEDGLSQMLLTVKGLAAGNTRIIISDKKSAGINTTVEVSVLAPTPTPTPSPTPEPEPTELKRSSNKEDSRTVYITRTGECYHYSDRCGGGRITYYECSLSEAKRRGLRPCSKCTY